MPSKTTTAPSSPDLAAETRTSASMGSRVIAERPEEFESLPPETGGSSPTSSPSRRTCAGCTYSWLTLTAMLAQVDGGTGARPAARWWSNAPTVAPSGSSRVDAPNQSLRIPKGRIRTRITRREYRLRDLDARTDPFGNADETVCSSTPVLPTGRPGCGTAALLLLVLFV